MEGELPREVQLKVLVARGWSIDERRAHGIRPGRLQLPELRIIDWSTHWRSRSKRAASSKLMIRLPSGRVYQRERDTFEPLEVYEQQSVVLWQGCRQILGKTFFDGSQWTIDSKCRSDV